ncbi:uncharacterized protein LOC117642190 [Thrips palmi]|uniref:Uncharacterized protein LOC117642190 n=1 Tax=Thrips palmi TaxID=161013 RepID=A0A6P8YPI0_THRPL|nr:uncharacterized protein LOC117642190 [Thrips palmi]
MFARAVALLALVACCAAASLPETKDPKDLALGFHEGDELAREQRSVQDFLKTLGPSPAALKGSKDQSFNIGGLYQYDRQLQTSTVYKSRSFLSVNTKELSLSGPYIIHCIQVVDLKKDGMNAAVTVQRGGIGQRQVTLKFKSRRGEDINYMVIFWGQ